MDPSSESLARAILHDLSNTLSGVQGMLDLARGLGDEERSRLDALVAEGYMTLDRARHLVVGTRPESLLERGDAWRLALEAQVRTHAVAFRCPVRVAFEGEADRDQWPGELLRGWAVAVTRQVLPYFAGPRDQGLTLRSAVDAGGWHLGWGPLNHVPAVLDLSTADAPRDIAGRWVRDLAPGLGVTFRPEGDWLWAHLPRF